MKKLSWRHVVAEKVNEDALIEEMRSAAKKDPGLKAKFREYGLDTDELDEIKIAFGDLDVSAKTKNLRITLNRKLLTPAESAFEQSMPYLIHEAIHVAQQLTGNLQGAQAKDYLDKATELESFKAQVDYKKRNEGEDEAKDYVEELLDYHDVEGKKRKEKRKKLLGLKGES
jgi:hypothetical protein